MAFNQIALEQDLSFSQLQKQKGSDDFDKAATVRKTVSRFQILHDEFDQPLFFGKFG